MYSTNADLWGLNHSGLSQFVLMKVGQLLDKIKIVAHGHRPKNCQQHHLLSNINQAYMEVCWSHYICNTHKSYMQFTKVVMVKHFYWIECFLQSDCFTHLFIFRIPNAVTCNTITDIEQAKYGICICLNIWTFIQSISFNLSTWMYYTQTKITKNEYDNCNDLARTYELNCF